MKVTVESEGTVVLRLEVSKEDLLAIEELAYRVAEGDELRWSETAAARRLWHALPDLTSDGTPVFDARD